MRCPNGCEVRCATAMNQAYASRDPKRARRLLEHLAHKLESRSSGIAAASLREGLDETLTVMASAPVRGAGTGPVLDQLDRELVQPGPRGRAAGQTLARRNHDPALDRRRCARSRASLPQGRRLSRSATGRRASRSRRSALRSEISSTNSAIDWTSARSARRNPPPGKGRVYVSREYASEITATDAETLAFLAFKVCRVIAALP